MCIFVISDITNVGRDDVITMAIIEQVPNDFKSNTPIGMRIVVLHVFI